MNKKEILIICLIMCFVLSLHAVSAADVNGDNNDAGLLKIQNVNNVSADSLPNSQNTPLLGSADAGTFKALQDKIDATTAGESITLENNYTWNSGTDGDITTGIKIDHDIIIIAEDGKDIVIDANEKTRVFNITNGAHVTLNGITFINGKITSADGNGGSILSDGELTIYNCTFMYNTATKGEGGAIYTSAEANITKSTFKFNKVGASKNGGAVHIGANSIISNSTFINNTAGGVGSGGSSNEGGGAVHAGDNLIVKNHSNFINNSVAGSSDGGAISAGNNAKISNSTFENCKSTYRGGALRMLANSVVSDCNFTDNIGGQYGGAISSNVNLEVYNSRFVHNTLSMSNSAGGAINIRSDVAIKLISNCTFINNTADAGGAIKTTGGMNIIGSRFINNSAGYGGAIAGAEKGKNANNLVNLTNCSFIGNDATGATDGNGGAVYAGTTNMYNSTFTDNTAVVDGGAYCFGNNIQGATLTINNTNFTSNVASKGNGGAINALTAVITYSNFVGNNATAGGAIRAKAITANHTNFTSNKATSSGGAVYNVGTSTVAVGATIIDNSNFTNNKVTGTNGDGGALYITGDNSKVSNLTFNGNNATRNGGTIYWSGGSGNILRSNFTKSKANNGGAIYITGISSNILYSNFTDDTADVSGGAIYSSGDNIHIDYSIFNNNIAKGIGTVAGGGAIYTSGLNAMITSNFTNNNATRGSGGAIYTSSGSTSLEINNPPYITYSNFTSNHAAEEGGAVFAGFIKSQMYSNTFINNSASRGGALSVASNDQLIRDSIFTNNTAEDKGGSVYFQRITTSEIRNSIFINSSALDGGAIYNIGGSEASVLINNDTFINNTAVYNGGAIYYVVDADRFDDEGVSLTKIYRDYDNFDGEGVISGGRTTVILKNAKGKSYSERIVNSLFENNKDYPINMTVDIYGGTAVVSLIQPKGIDKNSLIIFINITNQTGDVDSFTIDSANYDDGHWNDELDIFYNSFNLLREHNYTATITFNDSYHLTKVINSNFTTTSQTEGAFQILQDLIEEALGNNQNSISLTRPYIYDNLDIKNQTGCINITSPFTIYGEGWAISAEGYCRIFNITAANVTLENLVLTKGNASGRHGDGNEYGGAVYWSGVNGTLNNVNITSSYAGENGGGIYFNVTAANATVHQCTFVNNTAKGNGGAIDCNATMMYLTETTFISNHGVYGAALCREENATSGYGIYNTFIGNNATIGGAALGWIKAEHITITNYTFINNTAGVSGGALFVDEYSTSCTVINCTFEGNYIYDQTSGHGGAIEWYADKGIVINSTFTGNYAYDGGAIFANNESEEIIINNSHFNYNYAYSYGGAISLEASKVTINHTTFRNNNAVLGGGAVYVNGTAASNNVSYSVFENNWVSEGNGGGIDWLASKGNIKYTNFTNNSAVYGGGIYLSGNSNNSVIDHVIFIGNNATKNGGAIDWNAQNGHLYNTQFISNEAEYGAALCREAGAAGGNGESNVFISNHARVSGAALAWMGSDEIKIVDYNFTNNSAVISGGAIYVSSTSHNCSVIDCNFIDNKLTSHNESALGGAIDWKGADGKVINSNFTHNHAFNGGAIFVGTDQGITNITGSNFILNEAHNEGGAVSMNASSVYLNDTHFDSNVALSGGAIYVGEKGTSNYIYNSTFNNNKAIGEGNEEGHGGAINWLSAAGHILYSNFTNNHADYGGAIYLDGKSNNTVMNHIIFTGNNATKNGGAIDWNAENGHLYNCSFISNYAGEYGAALCREAGATGGNGTDNIFEYNHADIAGAALAWMGSVGIKITNYTFNYNTANKYGGAIYIAEDSHNCSIIDSRFLGNEALNGIDGFGGAVYTIAHNTTVSNSNFTLNKAYDGGAIYIGSAGGSTNITDSNFTKNSAVEYGGAVYLSSSNAIINRTLFSYNTAHDGGAIYAGGTGEVNEVYLSIFDNNRAEDGYGGAINWVAAAGYIYYTNFTNNYAKYGGGVHFNGNSSGSKVSYVRFENNTAAENGGAMESNATEIELTYTFFISNYAKYGAALCRESGATGGYGHNNTFDSNHAYISGAALAWMNVSDINIINYTFINNTAEVSGAAIYVSEGSDNCKVHECKFEENFVTNAVSGRGGAIDWIGDDGEVINSTFITCVAVEGGAIYVAETSNNMNIENSSFTSCRATDGNGGALELCGDNVTIIGDSFTSCYALKSGGAIATIDSDNLTILSSNFISCVSFDFGGAIGGRYSDNASITKSYFRYSHAAGHTSPDGSLYGEGGAIYWGDGNNLNVSNVLFVANNAYLSGGSISADNCNNSVVSNIKTYNETAEFNGGTISWINSNNVTLEHILFNDSGSNYNGGSIYLGNVNNVTVKDSLLNSTWASWGYGGGIYVGGNVTISNVTIRDGHDYHDDSNGIYFEYGNSTVVNSTFTETTNVIYIANATGKENVVYLINNNITASNPNKDTTYLDETYYKYYDYAVWNAGDLYLENNTFDYIIFNNGTIWTNTTTWILNNDTWNETWNTTFTFFANITDDNNNTIISVKSLETWNNVYDEDPNYPMPYNALVNTLLKYQGNFTIFGEDYGLKKNTVKNGRINVKLPTELTITPIDLSKDDVDFSVKLSVPISSNYTFDKNLLKIYLNGEEVPYDNITWVILGGEHWHTVYANFTEHHMPVGTYTISASYEGDDFHEAAENETTFAMFLRSMWISIHADDISYGEPLIVNVSSNATNTRTGRIIISVDGRTMSVPLKLNPDGSYIYQLPNENFTSLLEPGNHALSVIFQNSTYYQVQTNSSTFNVYKLDTPLVVNSTNITLGENEIINITLNENATGYIKISIGNQNYTSEINHGFAQFNISGLGVGNYTDVPVIYPGDIHFNGTADYIKFKVDPLDDYEINVIVEDITYTQNATVRVVIPSANGNVTIYIDGINRGNATLSNDVATLENIAGLFGGQHSINVTYQGDSNHVPKYNDTVTFMVNPLSWKVNITEFDYRPYGETTTINITNIPNNIEGDTITVKIDDIPYDVIIDKTAGKATLELNNLSAGSHVAEVIYGGDLNYSAISQTFRPNIPKTTPTINLTQNGTDLIATVSGNVTGNVTFKVNNVEHTINLVNGNATLVGNLTIGKNYVDATYNGNQNYSSVETSGVFIIPKLNTTIAVNSTNITYGDDELINVTVNENATGFVAVHIGTQIYVVPVNQGVARFNIGGLAANTYSDILVTYYPDDVSDFNRNSTSVTFRVDPTTQYKLNVTANPIEYGQNATVIVSLETSATGNVTIYVDGKPVGTVNVTNGVAILRNITGLAGGQHDVDVRYNGDSSYAPRDMNNTELMVNPNTSWKVNITEFDYRPYGETTTINITNIPNNIEGDTITVKIDDIPYDVIIDKTAGKATLELNNLSAGPHAAEVIYGGDLNYSAISQTFRPNIPKATPTITLDKDSDGNIVATVGGDNATGNVTFILDGCEYTIDLTSQKTAVLTKDHLKIGNNGVVAIYNGDNNYSDVKTVKNFTIDKLSSKLNVTVDSPINVGDNATIRVELPLNATGYVVVNVAGNNYTINLTDGQGSLVINGLKNQTYNVIATYLGDDQYLSCINNTEVIRVNKVASSVNLTVSESGIIAKGNNVNITIEVPVDATGKVNVTLWNGTKKVASYIVYVNEGRGLLHLDSPAVGMYNVTAVYLGDDKYNGNENSTRFTVDIAALAAEVTAFNVTVEENTAFVINVTDDFKGNVSIKVGDEVLYNGSVKTLIISDKLPAGGKTATVVFYGDSNYDGLTMDVDFTVSRVNPSINVTIADVTYPNNATAVINVGNYANGTVNVTVRVKGTDKVKIFNSTVSNGVARVNLAGLAGGDYEATVEFITGDDYNGNVTAAAVEFRVLPNNSLIIINASKTSKTYNVGEDVEIKFTTINSTGLLTIFINGVQYKSPLSPNPNIHDVCIEGLGEGIYTITAVLDADQNYTGDDTSVTIVVVKNNVTITVDDVTDPANIVVGSPVKFTANLNESVTGGVIFTINGANYTVHITDANVATYDYIPVNNDTITVVATFAGNDAYNASVSVEKQFDVGRIPTDINVTVKTPVIYGGDAVITVELNETITTVVKLTVGGKEYDVAIINGKGGFNVSGLNGGDYKVNVTYVGDDRYAESKNSTRFAVDRATPVITIDHAVTDANTSAVITVHINDTATGTMNITVNGKTYEAPINDGVAEFSVDVLPAGEYDITANYYALTDTNYTVNSVTLVKGLNVTKVADYTITVTGMNITVHDDEIITVTVPDGVTNVSIWVDGAKFTNSSFTGGVAKFNVTDLDLDAGVHYVNATVDDAAYASKVANNTFIVSPINTTLYIDVHTADIWDKEYINVTLKDANNNTITDASGNVIITLNGVDNPVTIENGVARFSTDDLVVGENIVCAYYAGEINYLGNHSIATFTVTQRTPKASVSATNVTVDTPTAITVTIPENATGYVIITGNFTDNPIYVENSTFIKGVATVNVSGLAEGEYNVHIKYYGLDADPYSTVENDTTFKVSKVAATGIKVDAHDTDYGKAALIEVTIPNADMTGTISLKLNDAVGTHITLPIYENKVTWNVTGLAAGKYTVYANYTGNYKYNVNDTLSKTFEVNKVEPSLTIDDAFTDALTSAEIIVHINKTATGSITIIVDSKPYTQPIKDGVANFTIDVLPAGDYDISAFYNPGEDKNYTGGFNTNSKGLHVTKVADYNIAVTGMNITVHDDEIITVSVPDGVTSVSIWVDGNKRTNSSFTGGIAKFNVTDLKLDAGVHYVNATVNDASYVSKVANNTFIVSPINTTLYIDVHTVDIWDKEYINVTLKDANNNTITDASGNVIITLNGVDNPVTIENGVARFSTDDLVVGENIVCAYYAGEINYLGNHSIATFTVTQRTPKASVSATNVTVDTPTAITVTIPENATGYVIITGNFTDNEIYVENSRFSSGVATVDVSGLAEGTYSVHIKYYGLDNDNYTTVENDTTFKVSKLSSKVTVEVDNITYGDNAAVNVTVTIGAASGNVTITIGDEYNKTVGVTDGVISVIVPGLTAGDKTVNVTYNGNYKYLPSSNSTDFTVSGADVSMIVITQNVTYGENETITVYVNAEGNVTFRIDNNDYGTVNITGGKAVLNVPLEAGNHTVEAIYNGAPGFNSTSLKANFTVEKADPIMSIDVQNIIFGGVEHIRVHVNAEGDVTIRVIGTGIVETISLENGEKDIILRAGPSDSYEGNATLNIYNIRGGRYPVEVTYNGNGNYNKLTASTEFEVYKADTSMYIEAEPYIDAGEDQTINITLSSVKATGWVYVYLAGRVSPRPVFDGLANYTTPLLESGKYQYVIIYEGDENFNPYIARGTFEVGDAPSLKDVSIDLDVEPYLYAGETQVINITMSDSEATGRVTIILDNNNYTRILDNGVANFTTPVLPGGNYTVVVIYEGNYMFNSNWTYDSFEVERVDPSRSNVSIGLEINPHVPAGETQVINITMSDSAATGKVTISVDGEKYTENLTNGAANFTIPALSSGNHTVVVIYEGDENFNGNWTYATFEVDKIPSSVSVDVTHNPTGENQTITVTADKDDATGYAIVDVDGTKYAVELNKGTGSITISGLTAGDHTINVTYLGDENYAPSSDETTLSLSKLPSGVEVNVENITVGDKAVIEITVPENATGNATVNVDGTDYTVSVAGGKGTLVLSDLGVGGHKVTVTYNGDEIYDSSSDSATFEVAKQDGDDVVKVTDQGDGTVVVEVPEGTTGTVTVEVDGENYTGEIVGGKAVINLENATPGVHEAKVTVPGNENRTETVIDTTVSIPKEDTPLDVIVDGDTIVVSVPEGASGNITVEVDGKTYTQHINGTEAKFTIDDLSAGDKTAVVKYAGDDDYAANSTSVDFTVPEADPDMKVTVDGGDVGDNVVVTVELPDDATGQVLIDIDGVGYYANVTDGIATAQIPRIPSGVYEVDVTYPGDDKYGQASYKGSFNVTKVESFVIPVAQNITVDDNEVIRLTVPEDATGTVTVIIDNDEYVFDLGDGKLTAGPQNNQYSVAVSGGKGELVISGLPKGEYVVSVKYNGDDKYLPSVNSTIFTVSKDQTSIEIVDLGNGTVKVILPDDATGNVTVYDGVNTYTADVINGTAVIDLDETTPGKHSIDVKYSGDERYASETETAEVNIPKYESPIRIETNDIGVGDTEVITVNLPKDASGKVTLQIDGNEYSADVVDGKAVFNIDGLTFGNKTVVVEYSGDDYYLDNFTTAQFTVSKVDSTTSASSKNINVGSDEIITANVPDDATGRVLVEINGVGYYGNIVNGKAKIIIPELPAGKYDVNVTYEGDDKYLPSSTGTSFTVSKNNAPISISADDITEGEDATIIVNVPEDATGSVTTIIDGNKYTKDVSNGKAVFVIPGLTRGAHQIDAQYSGDDKYDANSTITSIEVHYKESPEPVNPGHESAKAGSMLTKHAAGNPVWILLLAVLAVGSTQIRRFRK